MDIEFHYHLNFIIANLAGFNKEESFKIAYSAQQVDDNSSQLKIYQLGANKDNLYTNYISYTHNLMASKKVLAKIFLTFHFIPGLGGSSKSIRKDNKTHPLLTTPNNPLALTLLNEALKTKNLYRIGIASHAFADTWAHQNFIGLNHELNAMPSLGARFIPNVGHADALSSPDHISDIWYDLRLKKPLVNNLTRNLEAALSLFKGYSMHLNTYNTPTYLKGLDTIKALFKSLESFALDRKRRKERLSLYNEFVASPKSYDSNSWRNNAIYYSNLDKKYYWRNLEYKKSNWYQFQEAIKQHQQRGWKLIKGYAPSQLCTSLFNT